MEYPIPANIKGRNASQVLMNIQMAYIKEIILKLYLGGGIGSYLTMIRAIFQTLSRITLGGVQGTICLKILPGRRSASLTPTTCFYFSLY